METTRHASLQQRRDSSSLQVFSTLVNAGLVMIMASMAKSQTSNAK
jgi:hypothetical protein